MKNDRQLNKDWQGVDKDPSEERGKGEKVTKEDLKGKKVDADPTKKEDQPVTRITNLHLKNSECDQA